MSKGIEHRIGLKDQFTPVLSKINNGILQHKTSLKELEKTSNNTWSAIKTGIGLVGIAMAGLSFASLGTNVLQLASDAEEMQAKFNVVFGSMRKDAEDWATTYRDVVGGSRNEIKSMLADSQDMLTGFGASTAQGFELSKQIQTLGTDLASFGNLQGGAAEGVERMRKGLLGETENLKAMGIVINETILAQKLASEGDKRKFKDLTELEKVQLRYRIAVDQSKNAIGNAERESDGYASQLLNLKGVLADSGAEIGAKLLPVVNEVLPKLADAVVGATNAALGLYNIVVGNWGMISPVVYGVVGGLVAYRTALILANVATVAKATSLKLLATWTTFYGNASVAAGGKVGLLTLAQRGLNAAMKANPIGFIIGLIAMLVTGLIYLAKNWEQVKLVAMNTWNVIIDATQASVNWLIGITNTMIQAFVFAWDSIEYGGKSIWKGILSIATSGVNFFIGLVNGMIDNALSGINVLIKGANAVSSALGFGDALSEISFGGLGKVDFTSSMDDIEKPQWNSDLNVIPKVDMSGAKFSDDTIIAQVNKAQAEKNKNKAATDDKQDELIDALNNNTEAQSTNTKATKDNTKATKATLKNMTATGIADGLVSRIERGIWGTT